MWQHCFYFITWVVIMLSKHLSSGQSEIALFREALLSAKWDTVLKMIGTCPNLARACFIDVLSLKSVIDYAIVQNQKEEVFTQLLQYQKFLLKPNLDSVLFMIHSRNWSLINMLLGNNLLSKSYNYHNYNLSLSELLKGVDGSPIVITEEPVKEGIYKLYGKVLDPIHVPSSSDVKHPPVGTQRPKI